jgi:putative PIN family toxin of toxin-antitoxin system
MVDAPALRVLIDVNIFVSYLLFPDRPGSTIGAIVDAARAGVFGLVLPIRVLDELLVTLTTRPYLANRIGTDDAAAFVAALRTLSDPVPPPTVTAPIRCRDPKDDYLLAISYAARVDYLVSGDDDLLALRRAVDWTTIVWPPDFVRMLGERGLWG